MAGIKLTHVPFRGLGPAMNDLLGGHITMIFGAVSTAMGNIRAGTIRPLATTGETRHKDFPDLPTIAEAGLAGLRRRAALRHAGAGRHAAADRCSSSMPRLREALNAPEVKTQIANEGAVAAARCRPRTTPATSIAKRPNGPRSSATPGPYQSETSAPLTGPRRSILIVAGPAAGAAGEGNLTCRASRLRGRLGGSRGEPCSRRGGHLSEIADPQCPRLRRPAGDAAQGSGHLADADLGATARRGPRLCGRPASPRTEARRHHGDRRRQPAEALCLGDGGAGARRRAGAGLCRRGRGRTVLRAGACRGALRRGRGPGAGRQDPLGVGPPAEARDHGL